MLLPIPATCFSASRTLSIEALYGVELLDEWDSFCASDFEVARDDPLESGVAG